MKTTEEDISLLTYHGYDRSDLKKIIYLDPSHLLPRYLDRYKRGVHMNIYEVIFEYIRSGVRAHMRLWLLKDYSIVFRDKSKGKQKILFFNKAWDGDDY